MTFIRDDRDTARAARSAGVQQAAVVAAELAAIPGWLLAGDPGRLDDPALRDAALKAADLRTRLNDIHHGIAALDAELDALDGPRTESIYLFLEWSRWLEALPDADSVLDELVPDPRRRFLGSPPAMSPETAHRMLDAVAGNNGEVGDGDTFVAAAGLVDDDVWDLNHTARTRLDPLVAGHVIGVLLPMRLETRYRPPAGPGDPWRLRIRAHPDPVALGGQPLPANELEADLVAKCWTLAGGDLTTEAGAAAFATLAGAVGGPRAALLLRSVPVVPDGGDGYQVSGTFASPLNRRSDYRVALPETLQLLGDWGSGLQLLGEMHPDRATIAEQANLGDAMADLRPDRVPELWWNSYSVAEQVGLAVEVTLPGGPHLDVLVLTGLADDDAPSPFAAHAAHGQLGIVAPMSPSNTVAGAPAADLGRDPATWLDVARTNGGGTAAGLAGVLTGEPLLDGVPAVDTTVLDVVPTLVAALWPVLWQRWLKDVEHLPLVYDLGDWAARVLSPLGPYPALRIGDVPYGVLPAVDTAAWKAAPHDAPWEAALTRVAGLVLPDWARAGTVGGTAAGASAEQLLDIIGRVPTSRELGSRQFLPLEVLALFKSIVYGAQASDVVAEWEAMAARSLDVEPPPSRRYQRFGRVQPAVRGSGSVRELLERYLAEGAEGLAYLGRELEDDPPLLVRLLRHSLLLTMAEASRLDESFGSWTAPYEIPLWDAEQLAQDSGQGSSVDELPYDAQQLLGNHPPDPQAVIIARQFRDVRDAVRELAGHDDSLLPGNALAPAVAAVVDTSSHRFDPWVTAIGTRRLRRFIARDVPRRVGAYGWVDDLDPATDPTPPTDAGFLHAPGNAQAMAAAVLRDHAIGDDAERRWKMNVRSDLARLAARLAADVRIGVHISEALGREIERLAGDPAVVLELRRRFPARPEWGGRRVCDGLQVLAAAPASLPAGVGPLDDVRHVVDTYGDLLVADAVHDIVSGRGAAAQESMDAAAGLGVPAELRLLQTRRQGSSVRTTVLVALPAGHSDAASPVTVADPALAALVTTELGPAEAWTWTTDDASVTLADLGLDVADVALQSHSALSALAAAELGGPTTGGTAAARHTAFDRLCSLVGVQDGLPEVAGGSAAGEPELRSRLAALRSAAEAVALGLAAEPPLTAAARRWGLPEEGAAEVLTARLAAAGEPAGDATADALALGSRIRALLAPASGMPLICTGQLPSVVSAPNLDETWLEIVAAVRPAVARLEAHQLTRIWPSAATDPERLWAVPEPSQRDVVVYGPAALDAGDVAVALLDDWAETVPGRNHATHAAFGFGAPRARAPQAVLLAVPPDEQVPLSAAGLASIVTATRQLARARMAQPDQLRSWSLAVPTSMILTSGPAGATLVEPS